MNKNIQYKLSKNQKNEIAQNLIDILYKNANIDDQTRTFICNWILTDSNGKTKAFFDVWDIVLKIISQQKIQFCLDLVIEF